MIAINTVGAMQMFPTQSAYVAGKRGMDGVLRVLAKDVSQSPPTSQLAHPMHNLLMAQPLRPPHEKHARRVKEQGRVVERVALAVKAASVAVS